MDHVIAKTGMSKPTLSRIETGQRACTSHEAVAILTALAITGAERERLFNLTMQDGQQSWLEVGDGRTRQFQAFCNFESSASEITDVHVSLIPGVLQTPAFVRALMNEGPLEGPILEWTISARIDRQRALSGPSLKHYAAILDEAVLLRAVGGAEVVHGQVQHLIDLSHADRMSIRIVPLSAGYHRGCDGNFTIFEFGDSQPRVVYVDNQTASVFVDEPEDTEPYMDIVKSSDAKALDEDASRELLHTYLGGPP